MVKPVQAKGVVLGDLALPVSAVTSGITVLGQPETGKTSFCRAYAEAMLALGVPTIVLDPKGDYWGLRLRPDGKSRSGYEIAIFGGDHGDLELPEDAGKAVADALVDAHASAILDLSHFESDAARGRFVLAFEKRFYFRKKELPYPVQIIIDEVDLFAPQVPMRGHEALLHATLTLRKLGRKRGIGVLANAQRSSRIHKDLVEMSDLLICMQMAGRNDLAMLKDVLAQQMEPDALRQTLRTISRLKKGEAFAYSPAKFDLLRVVNVPLPRTFDSSRTPEFGEQHHAPQVPGLDLERLRKAFAAGGVNLEHEDVDTLKAQIRDLQAKLRALPTQMQRIEVPVERRIEVPILDPQVASQMRDLFVEIDSLTREFMRVSAQVRSGIEKVLQIPASALPASSPTPAKRVAVEPVRSEASSASNGERKLGKAERSILTVLAQYPDGRSVVQTAILTGYSVKGGGFLNALGALRSAGYVERGDPVRITEAGRKALGVYDPLPAGTDLQNHWLSRLGKAERGILSAVLGVYPHGLSKEEIAQRAGYAATGGGFLNALGRLRTLELVAGRDEIKANPALF